MDVWTPNVSDKNLYLEPEERIEHIPKNVSKTFKRTPTLPNCTRKCIVIGKRVNHGAGYGLEIPVNFKFLGPAKAIQ